MVDLIGLIAANIVVIIGVLVVSALPLYFAVKFVGGEAGIVKVILIGLLLSLASIGAYHFIGIFAGMFMLIATLLVYKIAFRLSFLKAFIAWVLQYVFVVLAFFIVVGLL